MDVDKEVMYMTKIAVETPEDLRAIHSSLSTTGCRKMTVHTVKNGTDVVDDIGEWILSHCYDAIYIEVKGVDTIRFIYKNERNGK